MKNNETPPDEELLREAVDAFWAVITDRYRDAEFGDLSPQRTITFWNAASEAVQEWVENNVPTLCKTCGSKIVEAVNESRFGDGECGRCEYRRYHSQPQLLADAKAMLDGIREHVGDLPANPVACELFAQLSQAVEKAERHTGQHEMHSLPSHEHAA
jgi:hypothetical protein